MYRVPLVGREIVNRIKTGLITRVSKEESVSHICKSIF